MFSSACFTFGYLWCDRCHRHCRRLAEAWNGTRIAAFGFATFQNIYVSCLGHLIFVFISWQDNVMACRLLNSGIPLSALEPHALFNLTKNMICTSVFAWFFWACRASQHARAHTTTLLLRLEIFKHIKKNNVDNSTNLLIYIDILVLGSSCVLQQSFHLSMVGWRKSSVFATNLTIDCLCASTLEQIIKPFTFEVPDESTGKLGTLKSSCNSFKAHHRGSLKHPHHTIWNHDRPLWWQIAPCCRCEVVELQQASSKPAWLGRRHHY